MKLENTSKLNNKSDIIVRSLTQPTVTDVKIENGTVKMNVQKELGIEVVGDTMVKVSVEEDEDDYEETVKAMDKMEGFISDNNPENEYHKVILEVENLLTNEKEKCFVYFYNKERDMIFEEESVYIPHGDWKEYMLNK